MSLRYLSDDQFWHSVYHEAGHLISGRRGRMVLEDLEYEHDGDDERAANEIARDMLIPSADLETFLESGRVDRRTIKAFASSQGIAAGIVVGRLQRDDIIGKTQMNDLRQRLEPVRNLGRRGA